MINEWKNIRTSAKIYKGCLIKRKDWTGPIRCIRSLHKNNRTYAEMKKHSPAGEDFSMIIDFNAKDQAETFLNDL